MVTCMSHNFRYNSFSHKLDLHLPTCPPNLCAILSFLHTVLIRRHDLTRDPSSCSRNPTYDKDMCGYNDKAGCKPLNGCGSLHAYWYILSFLVIISYVFLNLFIGVILEGFENSNDETGLPRADPGTVVLIRQTFRLIVPDGELLALDDLRPFMLNLPQPWGFQNVRVRRLEWMDAVSDMDLKVFEGNYIHFVDLVLGLTRRVVHQKLRKKGQHKTVEALHIGSENILKDIASQKEYQHLAVSKLTQKKEGLMVKEQVAASTIQRLWKKSKASRGPATPRLAHFISSSGVASTLDHYDEVDRHSEIMRFLREVHEMQDREIEKDHKGDNAVASSKKEPGPSLFGALAAIGFSLNDDSTAYKKQALQSGSITGSAKIAPSE
jgi:hypothetical protein